MQFFWIIHLFEVGIGIKTVHVLYCNFVQEIILVLESDTEINISNMWAVALGKGALGPFMLFADLEKAYTSVYMFTGVT